MEGGGRGEGKEKAKTEKYYIISRFTRHGNYLHIIYSTYKMYCFQNKHFYFHCITIFTIQTQRDSVKAPGQHVLHIDLRITRIKHFYHNLPY